MRGRNAEKCPHENQEQQQSQPLEPFNMNHTPFFPRLFPFSLFEEPFMDHRHGSNPVTGSPVKGSTNGKQSSDSHIISVVAARGVSKVWKRVCNPFVCDGLLSNLQFGQFSSRLLDTSNFRNYFQSLNSPTFALVTSTGGM